MLYENWYTSYLILHLGPKKVVLFPKELHKYGLNVDILVKVYDKVKIQKTRIVTWSLKGIPEIYCPYPNIVTTVLVFVFIYSTSCQVYITHGIMKISINKI